MNGLGFHFPPNEILYVKFGMIGKMLNFFQRPASWSNHLEYRLLEDSQCNFFKVKAGVVGKMQ